MHKPRILIVEDEQRLAELLRKQLNESGLQADIALDGYKGKQMIESTGYDLVILDINIPEINGYELCREIRKVYPSIPVLMLTALGSSDNKISGFDSGADDYITKPFDFRELMARINVFLRRPDVKTPSEKLTVADLEIDMATKSVKRAGKKIDMTVKEYSLLEVFVKNKGKLLTRDFIIENVWGIDFDPTTNIIDVYVNYLRKKIDKDYEPKLIHTKFGFGFYCSEKEI